MISNFLCPNSSHVTGCPKLVLNIVDYKCPIHRSFSKTAVPTMEKLFIRAFTKFYQQIEVSDPLKDLRVSL